jgi:autotransporter-associated beta strand protein
VNQSGGLVDVGNVGFFPLTGINNSAATYNLNGGILKTKRIFTAAPGTGSSATFVFNGGTVQAQANATAGFIDGGMTTVRIDAGGGTIDNGGLSLTVSKAMTGAGGLTCTGAGTLIFSAANTYSGGTTINSGSTLQLLGAGIVAGNVTNNGTLKPDHTGGYFNQNIYGTGQIVKTSSSDVQFLTGTTADTQTWSLAGLGRIFFQGQNQLGRGNIAITGTGKLVHITGGNVTLENAITMSSGGWLGNRASAAGVLTVTSLTLPASGTAVFNNDDTATTNLVASGPALTLTGGLTIQTGGGSTTVGDVTLNHAISGGFGVTKTSIGALTLTSANTYDGSTIVSNGTLLVNGSLAAGAVTVISGATLGGSGSIGGSVTFDTGAKALFTNGSTLAIAGALTANGNVVHLNIPSDLATNTYLLATYSGGSGSFASAPVIANGGSFAAGTTNYITTGGGQVNLVVANASVTPPQTNITYSVSSGELVLDWPAGEGWQLQSQTNNLNVGLGTNWTTITGATPPFTNSINATNPTVFYRLTYP